MKENICRNENNLPKNKSALCSIKTSCCRSVTVVRQHRIIQRDCYTKHTMHRISNFGSRKEVTYFALDKKIIMPMTMVLEYIIFHLLKIRISCAVRITTDSRINCPTHKLSGELLNDLRSVVGQQP